ncbi:hypothetical protein [Pseudoxanthomonas sp. UTMC 1351]|uniref:hypothetical protein n=1 Tax=Pseudoxanthomonas sp. UTMC 1351 TaxID=2695853 RepID=UPI0034CE46D2
MLLVLLGCIGNVQGGDTAGKSPNGVRYHGGDEIVLQGFHWNVIRTVPAGAQLKTAAAALNQAKVKPIYDIVPNHNNRGIASFPWRRRAGRDPPLLT